MPALPGGGPYRPNLHGVASRELGVISDGRHSLLGLALGCGEPAADWVGLFAALGWPGSLGASDSRLTHFSTVQMQTFHRGEYYVCNKYKDTYIHIYTDIHIYTHAYAHIYTYIHICYTYI